ncbi:MAG: DMT family transporter [Candidatus Tectomicrobia bacterium]|nr:DMT family transporter [Candidatus Tectomicrobia bacterium]
MIPGEFMALLAAFLWGASPIFVKKGLKSSTTSVALVFGVISSLPIFLLPFYFVSQPLFEAVKPQAIVFFALVGILGQCIGRFFNYLGIEKLGAARSTPLINTNPLFSAIFALIFLKESITLKIAVGIALILLGITIISQEKRS